MKLLITGICGFVGSTLAQGLSAQAAGGRLEIVGIDNLLRRGSEINRGKLARLGITVIHGDLRCRDDIDQLPGADWVIDAAANPSVLAGVDGQSSSRQVFDHNLSSTINVLEYCRAHRAGFVLLSTSRVYSIPPLSALPVEPWQGAFHLNDAGQLPLGISTAGVAESFSTQAPISLYGASKLASEILALEYAAAFGFPVWINRCGVLAGPGQFGRADQGIFSFWIHSYLRRRPLKYIGFGGHGYQVRDCLHPLDLLPVLERQFAFTGHAPSRIFNFGGGADHAISLLQLSQWCAGQFGEHAVASSAEVRQFDIPWMVMDSRAGQAFWNWKPAISLQDILKQIAEHAQNTPDWLRVTGAEGSL